MKILGNRVLVSRVEEEKKEGFQTVEVQDSFLYRGKVEQIGGGSGYFVMSGTTNNTEVIIGDIVLFAKYSPHTQTITVEGEDMKVIRVEDILAVE